MYHQSIYFYGFWVGWGPIEIEGDGDGSADDDNVIAVIRIKTTIGALLFLGLAVVFMWRVLVPRTAEELGHENENPGYLFGCYNYGASQIILGPDYAYFNGQKIRVTYGLEKTLKEVFYPQSYPWFTASTESFVFKNDRFGLVDLIQDDDGTWTIQVWKSDYLSSKDPADLDTVYFERALCEAG